MTYFVHPQGLCESKKIGEKTRIWAFAHVLPNAVIGRDCNICDHVFIENDVVLGDRVTVKCGVQLWDGLRVGDDVFIGPNATFTNDKFPHSKQYQDSVLQTTVSNNASIGANATILPGITIGAGAMVGAGSVVTRNVPSNAIVVGNPGRISGYMNVKRESLPLLDSTGKSTKSSPVAQTFMSGVSLHNLKNVADMRGMLSVGEFEDDLPFFPKRYFLVFDVPSKHVRGEHAHRVCHQFLICVKGEIAVVADNGTDREELLLSRPDVGLHVPPMVWCTQYKYSQDAVLLVFASEKYDSADYIRDYEEFFRLVSSSKPGQASRRALGHAA
jgi:UDP-2-acetamido-3-amino-2,3-dideoxy-glucuronate N-acetyltransferase